MSEQPNTGPRVQIDTSELEQQFKAASAPSETKVITWDDADPEAAAAKAEEKTEKYRGKHRKAGRLESAFANVKEIFAAHREMNKRNIQNVKYDAQLQVPRPDEYNTPEEKKALEKKYRRQRLGRTARSLAAAFSGGIVSGYALAQLFRPANAAGHMVQGAEMGAGGLPLVDMSNDNDGSRPVEAGGLKDLPFGYGEIYEMADNVKADQLDAIAAHEAHMAHVDHVNHETYMDNVDARAETIDYDAATAEKHQARELDAQFVADVEAGHEHGAYGLVDYLFNGEEGQKETKYAMGPPGDIYNDAGKLDAHEVLDDFDYRYKQDPALVAVHSAGFGLIDMKDVDSFTAKLSNDPDAWKEAVQNLYDAQAKMSMRFDKINYQYDSMYFADKNGDGVPELYHANDLDHGGMSVIFTDKKTGHEVILRADCGWQVISRDTIPNVPHINQPPVTPPVDHPHTPTHDTPTEEITRVRRRREHFTPTTPVVPHTPETPVTPHTPETPLTPVTPPVTPETPTTPETPDTPLLPKDESKSANNNPHVGTTGDRPVGPGKLTQEPEAAPQQYEKPKTPVAERAPNTEPVTRTERESAPAAEPSANKPLTQEQTRQNAGAPEGNVGNTVTVEKPE